MHVNCERVDNLLDFLAIVFTFIVFYIPMNGFFKAPTRKWNSLAHFAAEIGAPIRGQFPSPSNWANE